ncbi:hypothetical protein CsatB_002237 [Cannabis sativa]
MLLVPADSVFQFKFVNKFCYSLISGFIKNKEFVSKHLIMTKNQSSVSLFYSRLSSMSIITQSHINH